MSFLLSAPVEVVVLIFVAIMFIGIYEIIKIKKENSQNPIRFAMCGMILVSVAILLFRVLYEFDFQKILYDIWEWIILVCGAIFLVSLFISVAISYKRNEMSEKQKRLFRSSIPFFIMALLCVVLIIIINNL